VNPTTLYTNQNLTNGDVQLTETTFIAGVTAFNLVLKLEALLNPANPRRSIVLRHVTTNDVGTFNATTLAQIKPMNASVEITGKLPDLSESIKYYKIPLTPVEGTTLYTWLDTAGLGTDEIRATLILNEA